MPANENPDADLELDAPGRRRLPMLLRRCWYNLNQTFRRRIAHMGITPDQFTVLRTLLEGHRLGLTQSQLTSLISSDPNTIAALLERMELTGWIKRKVHERDRRAHRIQVTAAGRRKYTQARQVALELQTEILAVLPETKREEFLKHLRMVADACQLAAKNPFKPALPSD